MDDPAMEEATSLYGADAEGGPSSAGGTAAEGALEELAMTLGDDGSAALDVRSLGPEGDAPTPAGSVRRTFKSLKDRKDETASYAAWRSCLCHMITGSHRMGSCNSRRRKTVHLSESERERNRARTTPCSDRSRSTFGPGGMRRKNVKRSSSCDSAFAQSSGFRAALGAEAPLVLVITDASGKAVAPDAIACSGRSPGTPPQVHQTRIACSPHASNSRFVSASEAPRHREGAVMNERQTPWSID